LRIYEGQEEHPSSGRPDFEGQGANFLPFSAPQAKILGNLEDPQAKNLPNCAADMGIKILGLRRVCRV